MTERNPARNAARRRRRREAIIGPSCCLLCPYSDPVALVNVPVSAIPKRLLEQHHVVGRVNSAAATVPLCRNHHAELTEGYLAEGISMKQQPTLLHQILIVLRALGHFLRALCDGLDGWADRLERFITQLDDCCPEWPAKAVA